MFIFFFTKDHFLINKNLDTPASHTWLISDCIHLTCYLIKKVCLLNICFNSNKNNKNIGGWARSWIMSHPDANTSLIHVETCLEAPSPSHCAHQDVHVCLHRVDNAANNDLIKPSQRRPAVCRTVAASKSLLNGAYLKLLRRTTQCRQTSAVNAPAGCIVFLLFLLAFTFFFFSWMYPDSQCHTSPLKHVIKGKVKSRVWIAGVNEKR